MDINYSIILVAVCLGGYWLGEWTTERRLHAEYEMAMRVWKSLRHAAKSCRAIIRYQDDIGEHMKIISSQMREQVQILQQTIDIIVHEPKEKSKDAEDSHGNNPSG